MSPSRLALLLLCLAPQPGLAIDWIGGGGDVLWTTPSNWAGGVAPPSSFATVLSFGPSGSTSAFANAPWQVNRIDLTWGNSLSGATLSFGGAGASLNATGVQSMGNPLDLQADLTVSSDTNLALSGGLSGPGNLMKAGPGSVSIGPYGSTAISGSTTIDDGTLRLDASALAGPVVNNAIFEAAATGGTMTLLQGITGPGTLKVVSGTLTSVPPFMHTGTTQLDMAIMNGLLLGGGALVNNSGQLTTGDSVFGSIAGDGNLILTGTAITVGADNTSTSYTGLITGLGGLTKVGTGRLTIANNGAFYSGTTTISAGTLRIGDGTASPPSIFGTLVDDAALEFQVPALPSKLDLITNITGAGRLDVLQGWVHAQAGPLSLTGPVTVASGGRLTASFTNGDTLAIAAGGQVESFFPVVHTSLSGGGYFGFAHLTVGSDNTSTVFSGPLDGGGLEKVGTGTLTLSGPTMYTGGTTITSGTLRFGDGVGAPASIAGPIVIMGALEFHAATGTTLASGVSGTGTLRVLGGTVIGPPFGIGIDHSGGTQVDAGGDITGQFRGFGPLTIAAGGRVSAIDGSNFTQLSGGGELNLPGIGVPVYISGANTFSGSITGTGDLGKVSGGTLTLSGASTNAGGVVLAQGALVLTGSLTGPVQAFTGTTLRGTGTIGGTVTIDAGATIAPGLSPGQINTGNLALAGTAQFEILGPTLGTQYDNINVTGTVTLTGSTLQLIGAYVPAPGDVFALVTNDGADAVTGAFTGLPEGSTVTFNGVPLRVSYVGGTGNDVVLAAAPLAGYTWSGAGGNNAWSTNANWVGGIAPPSAIDTRVNFGAAGVQFVPTTDAAWTVNRIDLAAPGYTLQGSAITLTGAAPQLNATGAAQAISAPLVLGAAVAATNDIALTISGAVSGAGGFVKSGAGTLTLSGAGTFGGGITVNGGRLLVTGAIPGPVTVNAGGTVGGTGTIAGAVGINAGGTMAPGLSPGQINTGNLALGGIGQFEIEGTTLGTQYDNINVTGTVNITATLQLLGAYVPAPGDVFTIVTNDGVDPVTGTFAGLPEGATVTLNGTVLRVSYVGGTGNDVVLTALAAAAPVATPIPTLSEGALALLALVTLALGFRMRR